jgi:Trk K+ transport system NAD-binding subunit
MMNTNLSRTPPAGRPLLLLVGGGSVGRDLLHRSLPFWRISLVEIDEGVVRSLRESLKSEGSADLSVRVLQGDATSPLVLEDAGVEQADAVVVTTGTDRVNQEVCRLVVERYERTRVVSLVNDEEAQARFPSPPADLVLRNEHLAALLESRLHNDAARWLSLGTGAGKLVETTVMAGSPVIGRSLESLNARNWRIAAIHRDDELILPHGITRLAEGDKVLLIGKPDVLSGIAEYIRIGFSEFPRRYGERLLLPLLSRHRHGALLDESLYLARNTRIRGADLLCWQQDPKDDRADCEEAFRSAVPQVSRIPAGDGPVAAALKHVKQGNTGCFILPPPARKAGMTFARKRDFLRILEEVTCPILIPRGTHPYENILVPVADKAESIAAAELAMDLARLLGSRITAVSVLPPGFSVGEAALESQREALKQTLSLGNLYRMRMEKIEEEGNPVREILRLCQGFDLLVVSHRRERRWTPFRPDISHHLILRAPCSVLVVEMGEKKP